MSFLCSSDEEQRSSSGGSVEFPSVVSGPTVKFHRERKRKVHNEVERRRKDKISSLIFQIQELLPAEDTQKKCKNGILERTISYINYLKGANEMLLAGGLKEVQAEELRRLQQQVRHLEAQSKIYLRLLRKAGIHPVTPLENQIWSPPNKYPKRITPEQASALLSHQREKEGNTLQLNNEVSASASAHLTQIINSITPSIGKEPPVTNTTAKPKNNMCVQIPMCAVVNKAVTQVQNTHVVNRNQTLVTQALPTEPLMSTTTQNLCITTQKEVESHRNPPTLTTQSPFTTDAQGLIVLSNEQGLNMVAFQNKQVLIPNGVSPKSASSPTPVMLHGTSKMIMSNGLVTLRSPQDQRIVPEMATTICRQQSTESLHPSLSVCDGSQTIQAGTLQQTVMPFAMGQPTVSFNQQAQVAFNQQGQVAFNQQGQVAFNQQGQVAFNQQGQVAFNQQGQVAFNQQGQVAFNQQGQMITFGPGTLLTGQQSWAGSLPSALLLPNGQIIPVVSQPSVMYTNSTPINNINNGLMLATPTIAGTCRNTTVAANEVHTSTLLQTSNPISNNQVVESQKCSKRLVNVDPVTANSINHTQSNNPVIQKTGHSAKRDKTNRSATSSHHPKASKPNAALPKAKSDAKSKPQRSIRPKSTPPSVAMASPPGNNVPISQQSVQEPQNITSPVQSRSPSVATTNSSTSKNSQPATPAVAEKTLASSSPEASATDILAKATESIFSCGLPELSPPVSEFSSVNSSMTSPASSSLPVSRPSETIYNSASILQNSVRALSSPNEAPPVLKANLAEKNYGPSHPRPLEPPNLIAQITLDNMEPPEKRSKRMEIPNILLQSSPSPASSTKSVSPNRNHVAQEQLTQPTTTQTESQQHNATEPFTEMQSQVLTAQSPQHFQGGSVSQMLHQTPSETPCNNNSPRNSCHLPSNNLSSSGAESHDISSFVSSTDNSDHELPALILSSLGEDSDAPSSVNSSSNSGLQFLALSPPEQFGTGLANAKESLEQNTFNLMENQAPFCSNNYTFHKDVTERQQNPLISVGHFVPQNKPTTQSSTTLNCKHQGHIEQQQPQSQPQPTQQGQQHQQNHQRHQPRVLRHLPGSTNFLESVNKKPEESPSAHIPSSHIPSSHIPSSHISSNTTSTTIMNAMEHQNQPQCSNVSPHLNFMSNPHPHLLSRSYLPHENLVTAPLHPPPSNFLLPVPPPTGPFEPSKGSPHLPPNNVTLHPNPHCPPSNQRQSPFPQERITSKNPPHMTARAPVLPSRLPISQSTSIIDNLPFTQRPPTHVTSLAPSQTTSIIDSLPFTQRPTTHVTSSNNNNNLALSSYSTEALLGHQTSSTSLVGSFSGINTIQCSSQSSTPPSCSRSSRSLLPYSAESLLQNQPFTEKKNHQHHHHTSSANILSSSHNYNQPFPKLPPASSSQSFFTSEPTCLPCSSLSSTVVSHTPSFNHNVPVQQNSHHHHFNNNLLMPPFQEQLRTNPGPQVGSFPQPYGSFTLPNNNGSFQNRVDTLNCLQSGTGSIDGNQQMQIPHQENQQQTQQQGCLFPPVSHAATTAQGMQQAGPLLQHPDHTGFPPLIPSLNDGSSVKTSARPVLNHFSQPPTHPPTQNHFFPNPFVSGINSRNGISNHTFLETPNKQKETNRSNNTSNRSPQPGNKTSPKSKSKKMKQAEGYVDKGVSYFPVPELSNERFFNSPRGPAPQNLLPPPPMPLTNNRQGVSNLSNNPSYSQAPLFRPQSQLNFQTFPSLSSPRCPTGNQGSANTSVTSNIVGAVSGPVTGHVPNFNLSNIFPDMSSTAGDGLALSPIKFPPNPILPGTGQVPDPTVGSSTGGPRTSLYSGGRLPNSFNGILSSSAVPFERSPIASIHQNFASSASHPVSTFGNVIPPLNFPVHEH